MRHLFVINPKSFAREADLLEVARDIRAYFDNSNAGQYVIYTSRYPRDAIRAVKKYVSGTEETVRVYAVGGDGILYDCLNGLTDLPNGELAIVPYGISNDFLRAFGEGNQALFRDIPRQAAADTIAVDTIKLGNRCAINFCSIGIEAEVILKYYEISHKYPKLAKNAGKHLYMAGVPLVLFNRRAAIQKYRIIIDGVQYDGSYLGINLANGPCYGGNKTPVPMANPTDGLMDIMMLSGKISLRTLAMINSYTKGNYHKYPKILKHLRASEVIVGSEAPMHINVDGEAYYSSEINAKIVPAAVKIAAPSAEIFLP